MPANSAQNSIKGKVSTFLQDLLIIYRIYNLDITGYNRYPGVTGKGGLKTNINYQSRGFQWKEVVAMIALTKDEEIVKLKIEIYNLRKMLEFKVLEHGNFLHPEVILASKELDLKIFALMCKLHPRNKKKWRI